MKAHEKGRKSEKKRRRRIESEREGKRVRKSEREKKWGESAKEWKSERE